MDESDGILFTMNRLKREVEKSIEKIRDMARKWKEFFFSFFIFFFFLFFDPTTVSAKNKRSRVAQLEISITEIFENVAGYPASVQADTVHFHPPGTFVDEWREVVEKKNAQSKRERERVAKTQKDGQRENRYFSRHV